MARETKHQQVYSCKLGAQMEYWFYGVMVSTLDFESSDPSSNPGRTWVDFESNYTREP